MARLCFDYGHGGHDSGAIYNGRKESMDNLSIGMEVAKKVRLSDIYVDETRISDITLGLKERADFYVLRKTKMPAVLIEIGFIDNALDNDLFDRK
ncbi:N-acetylmuramoyl-L-alanine amidase [Tissierella praeacuta]|uniref:N-acetylmuramoyl-L-alanine amidase family protein n=1 Tax=Tissierella praeacuta TaxID=43131 RepID=UPI0033414638